MVRNNVIWTFAAFILIASVWNEYREETKHQRFFNDMRDFAAKGERYTSDDAMRLCRVISEAHKQNGIAELGCDEIINGEKEETSNEKTF